MEFFKLSPAFKDYIWGGEKLKNKYGKVCDMYPLAESWELSAHKDGESIILGGEYRGCALSEYLAKNPKALGEHSNGELPILIKLIDAADRLSVQVHPNDEQAREWEGQRGKTEMWYVVEAEKDAEIVYGVKDDISKEELAVAIREKRVEDLLNHVSSKKGDVFFVEAGTIHAIGKGNLIAEIQQNSNVTYRLYDYGRLGKDGKERELHVDKGVKAANCKKISARAIPNCSDGTRLLGSCEFFAVKELKLNGKKALNADAKSYHALIVTDGELEIRSGAAIERVTKGETLFIPAGLGEYTLTGKATLLLTSNPPRYFVGIDLGGTNIATAVVDEYGVIYGRAKRKTFATRPYNEIFDDMALTAREAVENSGLSFDDVVSVGIGCPGAIDLERGIVEFSNNLGFYDVPITEYMQKALGKKIYVANDANAAAWGEFLAGSGKGLRSMVMITLGTGVGSGIIDDGRLVEGAYGKGAELGHMVIRLDGEKCTCGRRGCFEAYASATALVRQTKDAMRKHPDSDMWKVAKRLKDVNGQTAFSCKDEASKAVVKGYLGYLSEGIVNIVNMLQPEVICLGGGIAGEGDKILAPVNRAIAKDSFARFGKQQSKVTRAVLGNDAGIIGAALLWKNYKE